MNERGRNISTRITNEIMMASRKIAYDVFISHGYRSEIAARMAEDIYGGMVDGGPEGFVGECMDVFVEQTLEKYEYTLTQVFDDPDDD